MILATRHDLPRIMHIIRHPDVRPWYGAADKDDDELALLIGQTFDRFLFVLTDSRHGFFQVERMNESGTEWMAHVAALPSCRGWEMVDGARETVDLLRAGGCERIYAWTCHDNRRARMFASLCGMKQCDARLDWHPEYYSESEGVWMEVETCPVAQQQH